MKMRMVNQSALSRLAKVSLRFSTTSGCDLTAHARTRREGERRVLTRRAKRTAKAENVVELAERNDEGDTDTEANFDVAGQDGLRGDMTSAVSVYASLAVATTHNELVTLELPDDEADNACVARAAVGEDLRGEARSRSAAHPRRATATG